MKNFVEKYNLIEKYFAGLVMLLIVLLGFAEVIFRFLLKMPVAWAEDYMLFAFVWLIYFGCSAATGEGRHVRITMLIEKFPSKIRLVAEVLSHLVWLVCGLIFTYASLTATITMFERSSATIGSGLPFWIPMIAIPVGMLITCIRVVRKIVNLISAGPQQFENDKMEVKKQL